jgi:hypothetical protein
MLPIRLRIKCTFDTFFEGGTFGRNPSFAVGLPETHTRDHRFLCFDSERGSLETAIDLQPKTAFESWLTWMFAPPLLDLSKQVDEALYVSEVIDGRRLGRDPSGHVDPKQLLLGFQPFLEIRLRERLRAQVGEPLAELLLPQASAWMRQQALSNLIPMSDAFSTQLLEEWLVEAYLGSKEKPSESELQALERVHSRNQRPIVSLIYLRWTGQWSALSSALRSSDAQTARRFTKWALTTLQASVMRAGQPGTLLALGLYTRSDQFEETVNLLAAILAKSPEEILATPSAGRSGSTNQIPIERLIELYALIVEGA